MLDRLPIAALNRLLSREPWARARLEPFQDKTIEVRLAGTPPLFTRAPFLRNFPRIFPRIFPREFPRLFAGVGAGGFLEATAERRSDVQVIVRWRDMLRFPAGRGGTELQIEGDPAFAGVVGELALHLRWDTESELALMIGDVGAAGVMRVVRAGARLPMKAGGRFAASAAEYAAEEAQLLVGKGSLAGLAAENAALERELDRLAACVEKLESARGNLDAGGSNAN